MSADILTDGSHPHGTVAGFQKGCRSAACPAPVSCREVHTRYQGDFGFRRAIDAGMTPADYIASQRPVKKAHVRRTAPSAPKEKPAAKPAAGGRPKSKHRQRVQELHAEELLDSEIADLIGISRRQVATIRVALNLPAHRLLDPEVVRAHHAQGMSDAQIAAAINATRRQKTSRAAIFSVRKRLGLPTNYTPATAGVSSSRRTT